MKDSTQSAHQSGTSLIEVVIAIVVLSVGLTGLFAALNANIGQSADPAVRVQANAVAQSYLEEIMLKPFCDPDLSDDCPATCTVADPPLCSYASCSAAEGSRAQFDDVCDYNGLADNAAHDQFGAPVPGLGAYNVGVTIQDDAVSFGGLGKNEVVRIDVTVNHATFQGMNVMLSGYKTNY